MDQNEGQLENFCDSSEEITEKKSFDFEKFCKCMEKSILKNLTEFDDVDLEYYLLAYEQLYNFFLLLGRAFQFVAIDVKSKIKILRTYQKNDSGKFRSLKNFSTVKSMINYEEKNKLLIDPKYVSGCRTLLRLHRGLDFVRKFLREIFRLENDVKLCGIAREVYNQTLAEYHSWVVRNAARVAMQFLPTRVELLMQISDHNEEKLAYILELFPNAIEAMNMIYDRIQHIYTENNLLDLP